MFFKKKIFLLLLQVYFIIFCCMCCRCTCQNENNLKRFGRKQIAIFCCASRPTTYRWDKKINLWGKLKKMVGEPQQLKSPCKVNLPLFYPSGLGESIAQSSSSSWRTLLNLPKRPRDFGWVRKKQQTTSKISIKIWLKGCKYKKD